VAVGAHAVRTRRPGWIAVELVLLVTFFLAPFRWLPGNNQIELGWNAGQQLVGATYVIVAIALLAVAWRYSVRRPAEVRPA
jgi:alpha-1,2-mannosyltransferase